MPFLRQNDLLKLNSKFLQTFFSWKYSYQPGNTLGVAETERSPGKLSALFKSRSLGSRQAIIQGEWCHGLRWPVPDYCDDYWRYGAQADAEAEARRNADPKENPA